MGFVRIEDNMSEGPKFDGISSAAGWLHVCALQYAAHALTDGFVPEGRVHKLTNDPPLLVNKAVEWLCTTHPGCDNPLWHHVAGGFQIHDYGDPKYGNPTRAGLEELRNRASAGGLASVEARRRRYGTAQPSSGARTEPEPGGSNQALRTGPEPPGPNASEHRSVPYRSVPYISPPSPPLAAGEKATVILHGFLEASNKSSYSAIDAVKAQEYATDFQRATGEQIADWLREHATWMASQKKRPYGKLEYYGEFLRQKHDWAADNGARIVSSSEGSRGGELTRISDIAMSSGDPADE